MFVRKNIENRIRGCLARISGKDEDNDDDNNHINNNNP